VTTLRRPLALAVALLLALLIAACDQTDATPSPVNPPRPTVSSNGEVVVFAASSLTDVFGQVAKDAQGQSAGITKVTYNFAGSQALVTQLSQGAKADILVTADEKSMRSAADAGVALSDAYRTFASNKLVVITAPGDQSTLSTLHDLGMPGLKLVLAAPAVPAGNYALQALDKLAADPTYGPTFKDSVLSNVVSREDNVRQVVAKVQLGEADAGIVYVTDARGGQVGTIDIPDQYNVVAEYFITVLPTTANEAGARAFVGYLLSDAGQKTLADFGFSPPLPK
jgi:molybdate transport system substrate-binding protein